MTEGNRTQAREEIRQQLEQLKAELKTVVRERRKADTAVKDSRKATEELLVRSAEIAKKEGILRQQIGELQRAFEGIER